MTANCPMTGRPHRTYWLRSAVWCHDCRQKIETCCEGPATIRVESGTITNDVDEFLAELDT